MNKVYTYEGFLKCFIDGVVLESSLLDLRKPRNKNNHANNLLQSATYEDTHLKKDLGGCRVGRELKCYRNGGINRRLVHSGDRAPCPSNAAAQTSR